MDEMILAEKSASLCRRCGADFEQEKNVDKGNHYRALGHCPDCMEFYKSLRESDCMEIIK